MLEREMGFTTPLPISGPSYDSVSYKVLFSMGEGGGIRQGHVLPIPILFFPKPALIPPNENQFT